VPLGVQCVSGSLSLPVTYAGPQKQYPGMDQINVRLPASLAGSGTVSVTCEDLEKTGVLGHSNTVQIAVH
jgi:uncharacterized protein (TIGR03437 family)